MSGKRRSTKAPKGGRRRGASKGAGARRGRIAGLAIAGLAALGITAAIATHAEPEAVAESAERLLSRSAEPGSESRARVDELATTVPATLELNVVARHPHDPEAFTQGLVWHDGRLFESTGLEGRSSLREVELRTGRIVRRADLDRRHFGEGLAEVDGKLVQLTWQHGLAFVWDLERFERVGEHRYSGEGWGLCHDGQSLVMSDGTDRLTFRDPETFAERRTVRVTKLGRPLRYLNELECVDGSVFANVWQTDEIVRIDPESGRVTGTLRASGLLSADERAGTDVLNGIAFVPETGRFLLTGKLWPVIFEVEIRER